MASAGDSGLDLSRSSSAAAASDCRSPPRRPQVRVLSRPRPRRRRPRTGSATASLGSRLAPPRPRPSSATASTAATGSASAASACVGLVADGLIGLGGADSGSSAGAASSTSAAVGTSTGSSSASHGRLGLRWQAHPPATRPTASTSASARTPASSAGTSMAAASADSSDSSGLVRPVGAFLLGDLLADLGERGGQRVVDAALGLLDRLGRVVAALACAAVALRGASAPARAGAPRPASG